MLKEIFSPYLHQLKVAPRIKHLGAILELCSLTLLCLAIMQVIQWPIYVIFMPSIVHLVLWVADKVVGKIFERREERRKG